MKFSDTLLEGSMEIRDKIFLHPFVLGIGDGSLPVEKFRFYLRQDYRFLIEYCRVFGLAVAKADDLADMTKLADLLNSTLSVEMELHRTYSAQFGITARDLEETPIAATTRAYTDHLLTVAWGGTLGEIATSLLPCQWDYWEIGRELAAGGGLSDTNPYREWAETYSATEFGELAKWLRALVDRMAEGAGPGAIARMERTFTTSARYELRFWEMAWTQGS